MNPPARSMPASGSPMATHSSASATPAVFWRSTRRAHRPSDPAAAEGQDGGSAYMRNARKLANGNYLVAHYGLQVVREYDAHGKVVWQVAAPAGRTAPCALPGGNTLIASADRDGAPARVFEVLRMAHRLGGPRRGVARHHLKFMAGLQRCPTANGDEQLAGTRAVRQGPAHHRGDAGEARGLDLCRSRNHETISSVEILDAAGKPSPARFCIEEEPAP